MTKAELNNIEGIHNHIGFGKYSDKTILEVLVNYPHLKEGASGKVVILSTGTLTSARTESALSAFPLHSFSKYLRNMFTLPLITALSKLPSPLLYKPRFLRLPLNATSLQLSFVIYKYSQKAKNSQYHKKKNAKKYLVIREKVSTFAARLATIATSSHT